MGWKKALAILAVIVAILLVGGGVAVLALSRTPDLVPYQDDLDPSVRDQQTRMALALQLAGLESAVAVVHEGTAYAFYDLPANGSVTPDDWQRAALAAMAPFAGETTTLVARQFVDREATLEWRVPTERVLAYEAGALAAEELETAITKSEF